MDVMVVPYATPALAVEVPSDLPVPLSTTGEWYCDSCHSTGAPPLYGRVLPGRGTPGSTHGKFGALPRGPAQKSAVDGNGSVQGGAATVDSKGVGRGKPAGTPQKVVT